MMTTNTTEAVQTMITTLTDALADATKHDAGNNAAGGRLRKTLQTISIGCKSARTEIQETRNSRKG